MGLKLTLLQAGILTNRPCPVSNRQTEVPVRPYYHATANSNLRGIHTTVLQICSQISEQKIEHIISNETFNIKLSTNTPL